MYSIATEYLPVGWHDEEEEEEDYDDDMVRDRGK